MNGLDQTVFLLLNLAPESPHWLVKFAIFGGSELMRLLMAATLAVALVGKSPWREQAIRALVAVILASVATYFLKHWLGMPRPGALDLGVQWIHHSRIQGMPSSHSAVAAAWAAVVLVTPTRAWIKALFFCVALFVGWCRIALGLHFPSQVLAGWVLGLVCALVAYYGIALLLRRASARAIHSE